MRMFRENPAIATKNPAVLREQRGRRGDAGNRTPVRSGILESSPGAVCLEFSARADPQTGLAQTKVTLSVEPNLSNPGGSSGFVNDASYYARSVHRLTESVPLGLCSQSEGFSAILFGTYWFCIRVNEMRILPRPASLKILPTVETDHPLFFCPSQPPRPRKDFARPSGLSRQTIKAPRPINSSASTKNTKTLARFAHPQQGEFRVAFQLLDMRPFPQQRAVSQM